MKNILIGFKIFILLIFISGCKVNNDKISAEQIRQALLDMKGRYEGTLDASFYQGAAIEKFDNSKAVSRDSLSIVIPLGPIASTITDDKIAAILNAISSVEVKAGYYFTQIDDGGDFVSFGLVPKNITIPTAVDGQTITFVFSDIFGGNFSRNSNFIMFNISPTEVLVGGVKLEPFKPLVYHFGGTL